ncbi:MAG: molybdenum cofactor guanylyltransferase [bacterium]|nr:MAG: molybdenum cofactor guanylyltransferase [bacterium]
MTGAGDLSDTTGVILVGGRSRRMGTDKVLLEIRGTPIVKDIFTRMSAVFQEILVVGHHREEFDALGISAIPDLIPESGVLGGIYTGLAEAKTPYIFAVAADLPFLDTDLIRHIASRRTGADAVIPRGPRGLEPLYAVYSRSCRGSMLESLQRRELKVLEAVAGLRVVSPEIGIAEGRPDPFINLNRPEDLERME